MTNWNYNNWLTQNSIRVIPKKKYRLRKWVEFVLYSMMIISGLILVCDATSIKTFIIKGLICLPIFTTSVILLSVYGGLNE